MLEHDEESSGSDPCSAEEMGEMRFMLSPEAPEMQQLQNMHTQTTNVDVTIRAFGLKVWIGKVTVLSLVFRIQELM